MKIDKDVLIGDIYAAATDMAGWGSVFAKFQQAFTGHSAVYERLHSAPETHQLLATDLDPEFVKLYNSHYNARNVWATSPLNQAAPIVISEKIIGPQALERTDFYDEWLRPQRLKHALTCPLVRQEHRSLNLGLVRDNRRGEYGSEDTRLIEAVLPHLRRAIEIASRMEATALARHASLEAVASSGTALFVVDRLGDIQFATSEAEEIVREAVVVTTRGRRLVATDGAENIRLKGAIQAATRSDGVTTGSLLVLSRRGATERHTLAVAPIGGERVGLFHDERLCVLSMAKPRDGALPDPAALAAMFDLTPAEARLARALCNGDSLADYAAANDVSVTTVKTHLRSLFGKTGVNRQADLVRIVLTNPVLSRTAQ